MIPIIAVLMLRDGCLGGILFGLGDSDVKAAAAVTVPSSYQYHCSDLASNICGVRCSGLHLQCVLGPSSSQDVDVDIALAIAPAWSGTCP